MTYRWLALSIVALAVPAQAGEPSELLPPMPIQVGDRPLDVQRDGHAAPFVGDLDGDGKLHLLVGQLHEGRLRIYRNQGSNAQPRFDTYTWFEAGGKIASVPVG
jgi:hypothetical protein